MAELIRVSEKGGLEFGDYTLAEKSKASDFPYEGDLYKVKTYDELTKLEKNGSLVYESVPGTKVEEFVIDERRISFLVEGNALTQIILDMEENKEYRVLVDDINLGNMTTNVGGKMVISVDLTNGQAQRVVLERI